MSTRKRSADKVRELAEALISTIAEMNKQALSVPLIGPKALDIIEQEIERNLQILEEERG